MGVLSVSGEKGRVKMEKKFTVVNGVSAAAMTLVSLTLFGRCALNVYAENGISISREAKQQAEEVTEEKKEETSGKRLMKTIPLDADTITQVPKYITEENDLYMLDESSIVVVETARGSAEGADVVTVSRKVENLPDNDLERIEKTILHEGVSCELLSVVYQVEEQDEYGIPVCYSAACEYGGLKKYSTSYPTAWQMTAWYDVCEIPVNTVSGTDQEEYVNTSAKYRTQEAEVVMVEGEERQEISSVGEEETPSSKPAVKEFKISPSDVEDSTETVRDIPVPACAAAAGAGVTLPFIIWFGITTAPIFAKKSADKYRYIGRIRLKKEEGIYTARLTKRLLNRAQIPVFFIRLPGRIWKKTKGGVLQIKCPDGKRITVMAGKTAGFTVEGE